MRSRSLSQTPGVAAVLALLLVGCGVSSPTVGDLLEGTSSSASPSASPSGEALDDEPGSNEGPTVKATSGSAEDSSNPPTYSGTGFAGRLTDGSGRAIEDRTACVAWWRLSEHEAEGDEVDYASPGRDGWYAFTDMEPGAYLAKIEEGDGDCGGHQWVPEWFDDAPRRDLARTITVVRGTVLHGIDFSLEEWGSIAGTVRNREGTPLAGVCVEAVETSPTEHDRLSWGDALTDAKGRYRIDRVWSGRFRVAFAECSRPSSQPYEPQWYEGVGGKAEATTVAVRNGHETPGIDAALFAASRIAGRVTYPKGDPVSGVCVSVFEHDPSGPDRLVAREDGAEGGPTDRTEEDGRYEVFRLPPGAYTIKFSCGDEDIFTEWYADAATEDEATPIELEARADIAGVDATVEHVPDD